MTVVLQLPLLGAGLSPHAATAAVVMANKSPVSRYVGRWMVSSVHRVARFRGRRRSVARVSCGWYAGGLRELSDRWCRFRLYRPSAWCASPRTFRSQGALVSAGERSRGRSSCATVPNRACARRAATRVGVRRSIGAPEHDGYLRHVVECHSDSAPVSEREFLDERLNALYSRAGSRCC